MPASDTGPSVGKSEAHDDTVLCLSRAMPLSLSLDLAVASAHRKAFLACPVKRRRG
jgi:hypothetical protein